MIMMIIIITVTCNHTVQKRLMVANHGENMIEEMMVNIQMKNEILKKDLDGLENMMKKKK